MLQSKIGSTLMLRGKSNRRASRGSHSREPTFVKQKPGKAALLGTRAMAGFGLSEAHSAQDAQNAPARHARRRRRHVRDDRAKPPQGTNRYPTPCTVNRCLGFSAFSPNFLRSCTMT